MKTEKKIGNRCYLCGISIGKNVHSFLQERKQGCNGICIPNLKKHWLLKVPSYWISACICVTEVPKLRKWCLLKIEQSLHLGRYIRHGGVWWNTRQSNKEEVSWSRHLLRIRNVNSWIKRIKFIMFFKVRWKDVWTNNNVHIHQKKKNNKKKVLMKCFAYFYGFKKQSCFFIVQTSYRLTSLQAFIFNPQFPKWLIWGISIKS